MFNQLSKSVGKFFQENSTTLLTAGGVIGTVATAVLTGRASFKAAAILQAEEAAIIQDANEGRVVDDFKTIDKVKLVGVQFIPPVLVGVATIGSIVMAHRMSAQKAAVLAAAYGISSKQRDEYKAKLEEKLGVKKEQDGTDEIQQARIDKNPLHDSLIVVGTGQVLFYDSFSDRYFKSTVEAIRKAERVVNGEIETGNECKLGVFYNELELPETMFDDMLGWNIRNECKVMISAMMMNNDACLCLEFVNLPGPNFGVEY